MNYSYRGFARWADFIKRLTFVIFLLLLGFCIVRIWYVWAIAFCRRRILMLLLIV